MQILWLMHVYFKNTALLFCFLFGNDTLRGMDVMIYALPHDYQPIATWLLVDYMMLWTSEIEKAREGYSPDFFCMALLIFTGRVPVLARFFRSGLRNKFVALCMFMFIMLLANVDQGSALLVIGLRYFSMWVTPLTQLAGFTLPIPRGLVYVIAARLFTPEVPPFWPTVFLQGGIVIASLFFPWTTTTP